MSKKPLHRVELNPALGDLVLNTLSDLVEMPASGIVAGGAVEAVLSRLCGFESPINDVDVFFALGKYSQIYPLLGDRIELLRDSKLLTQAERSRSQDTLLMTDVSFLVSPEYPTLGFCIRNNPRYQVVRSRNKGLLNEILINQNTDFTPYCLISSFDLNCTRVAVDIQTRQLFWDRHFETFFKTRQIQVVSCHTPWHTAMRAVKKQREMPDTYIDLETTLEGLVAWGDYLEKHKEDYVEQDKKLTSLSTCVFGTKHIKMYESVRSELAPYFDLQPIEGGPVDEKGQAVLATLAPRMEADPQYLKMLEARRDVSLQTLMPHVYRSKLTPSAKSKVFIDQSRVMDPDLQFLIECPHLDHDGRFYPTARLDLAPGGPSIKEVITSEQLDAYTQDQRRFLKVKMSDKDKEKASQAFLDYHRFVHHCLERYGRGNFDLNAFMEHFNQDAADGYLMRDALIQTQVFYSFVYPLGATYFDGQLTEQNIGKVIQKVSLHPGSYAFFAGLRLSEQLEILKVIKNFPDLTERDAFGVMEEFVTRGNNHVIKLSLPARIDLLHKQVALLSAIGGKKPHNFDFGVIKNSLKSLKSLLGYEVLEIQEHRGFHALKTIGREMGNCVGGYATRVAEGLCIIISLTVKLPDGSRERTLLELGVTYRSNSRASHLGPLEFVVYQQSTHANGQSSPQSRELCYLLCTMLNEHVSKTGKPNVLAGVLKFQATKLARKAYSFAHAAVTVPLNRLDFWFYRLVLRHPALKPFFPRHSSSLFYMNKKNTFRFGLRLRDEE